jgi:hypothetical protein
MKKRCSVERYMILNHPDAIFGKWRTIRYARGSSNSSSFAPRGGSFLCPQPPAVARPRAEALASAASSPLHGLVTPVARLRLGLLAPSRPPPRPVQTHAQATARHPTPPESLDAVPLARPTEPLRRCAWSRAAARRPFPRPKPRRITS